jgi:fimbrial chaperone protein
MITASSVTRLATAILLALGITSTSMAASLSVSPIVVTLDEKNQSAALILKNEGNETRVIETELRRWTQTNGNDVDVPSADILVTPADVTLKPGQSRTIHLFLRRKAPDTREVAYRFYVDEVPTPLRQGYTGLRIALRLGVPVFVSPVAAPVTRLDWRATHPAAESPQLIIENNGNVHIRLTSLKISDPVTGQPLFDLPHTQITVLAGQAQRIPFSLPQGWRGKELRVVASGGGEEFRSSAELED